MSSIYDVMGALQIQVETATAGALGIAPIKVGVGWPPVTMLQDIARNGGAAITVYDRKVGRNTTRWAPYAYNQVAVASLLTTTLNPPPALPPMGSGSVTLGGPSPVGIGDAVSLIASTPQPNQPSVTAAVVVSAVPNDTPAIMATKLAAAVNADPVLSTWLSAAAVGAVVNLTNLTTRPVALQSYAGNGGTQIRELARRESQLQVVVWTKTQNDRQAVVDRINTLLGNLQVNFGLTIDANGTVGRLETENDYPIEDDTLEDVYRHDFLARVDYPITTQDILYAVLAPVPAFAVAEIVLEVGE